MQNYNGTFKDMLDVTAAVTITVREHNVIEAKWLTYSISPIYYSPLNVITEGYASPIDKMYSGLRMLGIEQPVFESVEPIYDLIATGATVKMGWGVKYENIWYQP